MSQTQDNLLATTTQTIDGEVYSAQVFRSTPEVEEETGYRYYMMDEETGEIFATYKDAPTVEQIANDFQKFCNNLAEEDAKQKELKHYEDDPVAYRAMYDRLYHGGR